MEFLVTDFVAQNLWLMLGLFAVGVLAHMLSILLGGGGALFALPAVTLAAPAYAAPILNLGSLIGRPVRLALFWSYIDWRIVAWYAPFSIVGALVGTYVFSSLNPVWIQLLLGLFLLSTPWQYRLGKKTQSFAMPLPAFAPLGFLVAAFTSLTGALGPVLNPFYFNAHVQKEAMTATKTMNSVIMGLAQVGGYLSFGVALGSWVWLGVAFGLGAALGSFFGKRLLVRLTQQRFLTYSLIFMSLSGAGLVWVCVRSLVSA